MYRKIPTNFTLHSIKLLYVIVERYADIEFWLLMKYPSRNQRVYEKK